MKHSSKGVARAPTTWHRLGLLVAQAMLLGGCEADPVGPKPCNEEPSQCTNGETCWPNQGSTAFECLGGGAGKFGDTCQLVAGAPTCGEGLICITAQGSASGACTSYCNPPSHECLSAYECSAFTLGKGGTPLKACAPLGGVGSTGTGK